MIDANPGIVCYEDTGSQLFEDIRTITHSDGFKYQELI